MAALAPAAARRGGGGVRRGGRGGREEAAAGRGEDDTIDAMEEQSDMIQRRRFGIFATHFDLGARKGGEEASKGKWYDEAVRAGAPISDVTDALVAAGGAIFSLMSRRRVPFVIVKYV